MRLHTNHITITDLTNATKGIIHLTRQEAQERTTLSAKAARNYFEKEVHCND